MEKYSKSSTDGNKRINTSDNNLSSSCCDYNSLCFARIKDSSYGSFVGGFSWPPRSYTCKFCKREFRSAQALGGHMNVHRRDRARMRLSSPWDATTAPSSPDPNSNPNPNPEHKTEEEQPRPVITIPNLNHVPTVVDPFHLSDTNLSLQLVTERFHQQISAATTTMTTTIFSSSSSSPPHFVSRTKPRVAMEVPVPFDGGDQSQRKQGGRRRRFKVGDVRLDLKIGRHPVEDLDNDRDLDLELRLGYT